jgi:hypothetical protein
MHPSPLSYETQEIARILVDGWNNKAIEPQFLVTIEPMGPGNGYQVLYSKGMPEDYPVKITIEALRELRDRKLITVPEQVFGGTTPTGSLTNFTVVLLPALEEAVKNNFA